MKFFSVNPILTLKLVQLFEENGSNFAVKLIMLVMHFFQLTHSS